MPSHSPEILHHEIVALSHSETWTDARLEWRVRTIFHDEDGTQCLCTYRPIKNYCEIFNPLTKKSTIVGSTCVKKFWDKDYRLEFASLQRLKKDPYSAMNYALLQYVKEQHWLNDRDCKFYCETFRKKRTSLSPDQLQWRKSINEKVIGQMKHT